MQHNLPFLVPIIISLGAFLFVAALRYMRHIERMNMIERGIGLDEVNLAERRRGNPLSIPYLLIGAAVGLLIAIFTTRMLGGWLNGDESVGLYFAFIGLCSGFGLILAGRKNGQES